MVFYSLIFFLGFLDAPHIHVHCGHLVYDIFSRHLLAFRRHICVEGLIDGAVLLRVEVNFPNYHNVLLTTGGWVRVIG